MGKGLKACLVLASTLLLVACGSETVDEPVVDTPVETTEVVETVEETTEVVEEETTEDVDKEPTYTVKTEYLEGGDTQYLLEGVEDERGWTVKHEVIVNVKGEIIKSDFNYVNADGVLKTEDDEYVTNMEDGSGNNLHETIEYLNNYLIENNGLEGLGDDSVDVVSGATGTYTLFVETANELLANI